MQSQSPFRWLAFYIFLVSTVTFLLVIYGSIDFIFLISSLPVSYLFSYCTSPWMRTSIKGDLVMIHHLLTLKVLSDLGVLLSTEHGELIAIHLNPSSSPQRLCGRCVIESLQWVYLMCSFAHIYVLQFQASIKSLGLVCSFFHHSGMCFSCEILVFGLFPYV